MFPIVTSSSESDEEEGDIAMQSEASDSDASDDDDHAHNDNTVPILTFLSQGDDAETPSDDTAAFPRPPSPKRAPVQRYFERLLLEVAKAKQRLAMMREEEKGEDADEQMSMVTQVNPFCCCTNQRSDLFACIVACAEYAFALARKVLQEVITLREQTKVALVEEIKALDEEQDLSARRMQVRTRLAVQRGL